MRTAILGLAALVALGFGLSHHLDNLAAAEEVRGVTVRLSNTLALETGKTSITFREVLRRVSEAVDHAEAVALRMQAQGRAEEEAYVRASQELLRALHTKHARRLAFNLASESAERLGERNPSQMEIDLVFDEAINSGKAYEESVLRTIVAAEALLSVQETSTGLPDDAMLDTGVLREAIQRWQ